MDIDKIKPGRELDDLIAEKVLGLSVCKCPGNNRGIAFRGDGTAAHVPGCGLQFSLNYSLDIGAAWKVLEKLCSIRGEPNSHPAKDGRVWIYKPVIRLEFYEHDGIYSCRIGRCKSVGEEDDIIGRADDGPECSGSQEAMATAICRAALKAIP